MAVKTYFKIIVIPALLAIMLALGTDAKALEKQQYNGDPETQRRDRISNKIRKLERAVEKLEKAVGTLQFNMDLILETNEELQSQVKQLRKDKLACKDSDAKQLTFEGSCSSQEAAKAEAKAEAKKDAEKAQEDLLAPRSRGDCLGECNMMVGPARFESAWGPAFEKCKNACPA